MTAGSGGVLPRQPGARERGKCHQTGAGKGNFFRQHWHYIYMLGFLSSLARCQHYHYIGLLKRAFKKENDKEKGKII